MLAQVSMKICNLRQHWVDQLNDKMTFFFKKMTSRSEALSLQYISSLGKDHIQNENDIFEKLEKQKIKELHYGYSYFGPHRDDFKLFLDEKGDKEFFSQGEMKVTTLSLKLAINELISELCQVCPILIFDDLFSEFDLSVCNNVMQFFSEIPNQIFITSTNFPDQFQDYGKRFVVKQGVVSHEN